MSDDRGSSTGTAEKKEECVKEFIVSDKFKKMMDDAFNATKSVLKKRAKNLKDWTENDKQEFSQIFGVSGDVIITSTYFAKRVADKLSENVDARTFMIDGVNRMIMICDSISVESRSCQNGVNLYGNFINNTHIFPGSARVNNGITIGLSPDQYKETLRIEILQILRKSLFLVVNLMCLLYAMSYLIFVGILSMVNIVAEWEPMMFQQKNLIQTSDIQDTLEI